MWLIHWELVSDVFLDSAGSSAKGDFYFYNECSTIVQQTPGYPSSRHPELSCNCQKFERNFMIFYGHFKDKVAMCICLPTTLGIFPNYY